MPDLVDGLGYVDWPPWCSVQRGSLSAANFALVHVMVHVIGAAQPQAEIHPPNPN